MSQASIKIVVLHLFRKTSKAAANFVQHVLSGSKPVLPPFQGSAHSEMFSNYIPPVQFNFITVVVVAATLVMGILLPDIEFVLGIVSASSNTCSHKPVACSY